MKIIVPMSGVGQRFINAGYTNPKPLIEVDGKPIIEHVVEMFSNEDQFVFVCNRKHLETTELGKTLERIAPGAHILAVEPHKLGPVHAVLEALKMETFEDDEPVVVNYCDFSVEWNWPAIKQTLIENGCDGAVPAYRGFHPHMLGTTNYAFMKDQDGWMEDIQEKKPWTDDRRQEYASTGTYYFSRTQTVKKYFKILRQREDLALNGEYYVSLVYKLMAQDGLKVFIPEVAVMLQWGTPEDLEEYQGWSDFWHGQHAFEPTHPLGGQVLIPMAGAGSRFAKEGYRQVKPLIKVSGQAMILKAAASLPCASSYTFVCREEHRHDFPLETTLRQRWGNKVHCVWVDHLTQGQACTCLLGMPSLNPEQPLMIGACDNGMVWDEAEYAALIADKEVDAVVWTHRGYAGARRNPEAYGWVQTDAQGWIKAVSVKAALSSKPQNDAGIVGAFWFRKARYFQEVAERLIKKNERINNEFYVDSCVTMHLELGRRAKIFDVQRYLCWGTPDDLRTWEYWEGYFKRRGVVKDTAKQASLSKYGK